MLFGKPTTTKQEVNVNTNLYSSYSETAQLIAKAWNNQLSITIKPCVGTDANGVRQYAEDKSQFIITSITPENAICLVEGFEADVLPAVRGMKESGSASIAMGNIEQRKILTIGYDKDHSYLSIAVNLDANGKAGGEIRHIFNKKEYLIDYNPSVGNATEKVVEADLFNFMEKVRSVKDLSPIIAHSIKYNEASRASFASNYTNNANQNNTNIQNDNSGYQAPVTTTEGSDMSFLPF
jgi:hypothetical protein